MMKTRYEVFRDASEANCRLLDQEGLILEVTEAIAQAMEEQGVLQKDLAERLGKSKGYVSQLLGGGRNLTLRTIADVAGALDCEIRFALRPRTVQTAQVLPFSGRVESWRKPLSHPKVIFRGLEQNTKGTLGVA